jgi:type II secretion system protein J
MSYPEINMGRARRQSAGDEGFSLLEVIIATAVSSVILLMVYSAHRSIMAAIYDLTGIADFYENVGLAVQRIDKDISYVFYSRFNNRVQFIGANDTGNRSNGRVQFVSSEYTDQVLLISPKIQCPRSDIREVGYYLRQDREKPGLYRLMRREENHYDDDSETGGDESVLLENIVDIKFDFRQQNEWTDKWDSREHRRFPQAVRTTLTVKNYRGVNEDFIFLSYLNPVN